MLAKCRSILIIVALFFFSAGPWLAAQSPVVAPTERLEVGSFCTSYPYGLTMLVDRGAAFVINPHVVFPDTRFLANDESLAAYPTCAPDGSFFKATFTSNGAKITWTFGKLNDSAVGAILTTDRPVSLPVRFLQPFSGCRTLFWREGDAVGGNGYAGNTGKTVPIRAEMKPRPNRIIAERGPEAEMVCDLVPETPAVLVVKLGDAPAPSFDSVAPALDTAAKAYAARRVRAEGDWGDFVGAIADVMNSSRYFSSLDRIVSHSVGRGWWIAKNANRNPDYTPYFCWDSNFNGALGALEDFAGSCDTIRAVFSLQDPRGMISNYSHWPADNAWVAADRSQPPVASLCIWKMYQRWPDKNWLAEMYPKLVKWHDWWHVHRCKKGEFLLSWGSSTNNINNARLETGWDDTLSFGDARMVDGLVNQFNVDLNSMWAMDAEHLALLAGALGKTDDAARFRWERDRMAAEMNDKLWNDQLGLYCNRFWDNNPDGTPRFVTRISPMNFYPLIAGVPNAERARRTLEVLHDPAKFWGEYPIPTLPYGDPNYHEQEYWHGHVWAPANYLVWQGVLRYDDPEHQVQLVRRSIALFMKSWNTEQRICGENYRSDTGVPNDHLHYTWGALLPLMGIEALIDIGPELVPRPRRVAFTEKLVLHHIPVGGKLYRVECKSGEVTVTAE